MKFWVMFYIVLLILLEEDIKSMLKIDVRLSKINHWIWNSQIRAIKIWLPMSLTVAGFVQFW